MFYSPIKAADLATLNVVEFVAPARKIARSLKAIGYATDDLGLAAIYTAAVYQDGSNYLAGYFIYADAAADLEYVVDDATRYADAEAAAVAADAYTDFAAHQVRNDRAALTDAEYAEAAERARAPWLRSGAEVDIVRSLCAA